MNDVPLPGLGHRHTADAYEAAVEAGVAPCFGCKLQAIREGGGLRLSSAATPTRTPSRTAPAWKGDPSWEKGVAGEHRPDGSFMPYVRPDTLNPIPVKEFSENRTALETARRRLANS